MAAGERWMGKWIFFDALSRGLLAVVQPDLAHAGGITECKKIAAIAEAAFATVALHCPLSPLAFAASVQLDAAIPNFLVQEHNEVNDTRDGGRTVIGAGYLRDPFVEQVTKASALVEAEGYCKWTRVEEIVQFAKRMGYKKIGIASAHRTEHLSWDL